MRGTTAARTTRKTEEARLWQRFMAHPTERRHEALWMLYQPLVRHLAERFLEKHGPDCETADVIAAGNVGLLDALAEFNTGETSFVAHAGPLIRDAIRRSLPVQRAHAAGRLLAESGVAHGPRGPLQVATPTA